MSQWLKRAREVGGAEAPTRPAPGRTPRLRGEQRMQLPGYAPDLSPDEGIWNYLKRADPANVCYHNLVESRTQVIRVRERLRRRREIIRACSRQCGYVA